MIPKAVMKWRPVALARARCGPKGRCAAIFVARRAQHHLAACHDPHHRVIHVPYDGTIVNQEKIGDAFERCRPWSFPGEQTFAHHVRLGDLPHPRFCFNLRHEWFGETNSEGFHGRIVMRSRQECKTNHIGGRFG